MTRNIGSQGSEPMPLTEAEKMALKEPEIQRLTAAGRRAICNSIRIRHRADEILKRCGMDVRRMGRGTALVYHEEPCATIGQFDLESQAYSAGLRISEALAVCDNHPRSIVDTCQQTQTVWLAMRGFIVRSCEFGAWYAYDTWRGEDFTGNYTDKAVCLMQTVRLVLLQSFQDEERN